MADTKVQWLLILVVSSMCQLIMVDQSFGAMWDPANIIFGGNEKTKCSLLANMYPTEFVLCKGYHGQETNWTMQLDTPFSPFVFSNSTVFEGNLDPNREIVFFVHGFLHGCNNDTTQSTKAVYFEARPDVQMVAVCWSNAFPSLERIAGSLSWGAYALSYDSIKCVGMVIAKFIEHLHVDLGVPWENMSIVGFSLGGLVGAATGTVLPSLHKLIALDPAPSIGSDYLSNTSAKQVIVLHTSFSLGRLIPQGSVDFYANFGSQPGCDDSTFSIIQKERCSHHRSVDLFKESLKNPKAFKVLSTNKEDVYFSPYTTAKGVYVFKTGSGKDQNGKKVPFSLSSNYTKKISKLAVGQRVLSHAKEKKKPSSYSWHLPSFNEILSAIKL